MPNPYIQQKQNKVETPEISEDTKHLFRIIYNEQNGIIDNDENIPKIKVSDFISKMAFYYEKIRNSVDYKEEHLLRKNAIERILKREIVIQGLIKKALPEKVSKHLLIELIRAAYLPNDIIPESKIDEIAMIIERYIKLRDVVYAKTDDIQERSEYSNWIIAMAACEIEENLGLDKVTKANIEHLFSLIVEKTQLPEDSIHKKDKKIQIFLAIHRKLLKFDDHMLGFILLKYYTKTWQNANQELIEKIGNNIEHVQGKINQNLDHPIKNQLNKIVAKYTVFFDILTQVATKAPSQNYVKLKHNFEEFSAEIKKVCAKKYATARSKLWRAAIRSILYIFITKSVFVLLIEIPVIKWFGEEVNNTALAINIGFPALLLFIIVLFTKLPDSKNTAKIIQGIKEITYKKTDEVGKIYKLRKPVKRSTGINLTFALIYGITFIFSFGFIIWGLHRVNFNWVSISIFLFFLAFVSFFSFRIRKSINELRVVEASENIFSFFSDFFYIPILATGKWLSDRFARVNVFVFILDYILEAPFKTFVEIAEEWGKYVKERKEEIV